MIDNEQPTAKTFKFGEGYKIDQFYNGMYRLARDLNEYPVDIGSNAFSKSSFCHIFFFFFFESLSVYATVKSILNM